MTVKDIIIQSCKFDTKNKDLIKKEGVVFTSLNICNEIIEKLEPKITDTICEPSVGKGIFIFALLEWFRNKGENIESIKFPQYRKYKNNKNYFKIHSMESFEEIQIFGQQKIISHKEVKILPDRNFLADLLFAYENFAEEITEEEYFKIRA